MEGATAGLLLCSDMTTGRDSRKEKLPRLTISPSQSPRVPERFRRATTTRCEKTCPATRRREVYVEGSIQSWSRRFPAFEHLPARGQLHGDGVYISKSIESRATKKNSGVSGKKHANEAQSCYLAYLPLRFIPPGRPAYSFWILNRKQPEPPSLSSFSPSVS